MSLAVQPDSLPTNKMIVTALLTVIIYHFGDAIIPSEVMGAYGVLISLAVGLVTAYLVPDRANIPK